MHSQKILLLLGVIKYCLFYLWVQEVRELQNINELIRKRVHKFHNELYSNTEDYPEQLMEDKWKISDKCMFGKPAAAIRVPPGTQNLTDLGVARSRERSTLDASTTLGEAKRWEWRNTSPDLVLDAWSDQADQPPCQSTSILVGVHWTCEDVSPCLTHEWRKSLCYLRMATLGALEVGEKNRGVQNCWS